MSANEQMAASEGLGFVPYTRPTGTDTSEPLKIGVLISGSGTNLQALIDLIAADKLNASIELVVSSRPSAKGLQRAERAGIQTLTLSKDVYADPIAADEIIAHELLERGCEYVVMAGYMRMVHTPLLAAFSGYSTCSIAWMCSSSVSTSQPSSTASARWAMMGPLS